VRAEEAAENYDDKRNLFGGADQKSVMPAKAGIQVGSVKSSNVKTGFPLGARMTIFKCVIKGDDHS